MSVYNSVIFKDFNLTPRAKKAYKDAYDISVKVEHNNVNNLHVLYGCFKNNTDSIISLLAENNISLTVEDILNLIIAKDSDSKLHANSNSDPWHKEVTDAIKYANNLASELDQHFIGIEHVLLGIINVSSSIFDVFESELFDFENFKNKLECLVKGETDHYDDNFFYFNDSIDSLEDLVGASEGVAEDINSDDKHPDFITSLNELYVSGKLSEVFGREAEVDSLIETLSKKNKSNAILTGEAGVGKTAIVEALTKRICQAKVPRSLLGMEIISVDLGSMLAGTQYRGQFEQKFKTLLNMAKENPHIILFFDEIHTIFGAGGNQEGSIDAANMLKPFLARGEVKCIGATTQSEYNKIFKKDGAMKRRFFNIEINEPSTKETKEILYNCKHKYESFHNVKYSKTIIDYIVDLSDSLISHKQFPDKAFDVLDQSGSRVKIRNSNSSGKILKSHTDLSDLLISGGQVSVEDVKSKLKAFISEIDKIDKEMAENPIRVKKSDVLEIISEHGKVSIDQIQTSSQGFGSFLKRISNEVFGQDQILSKINDLLSCAKAGLTEKNKPLASMFFVGPTSVGKTYTAKKIAKHYFGNEKALLQINMSELYDKTGISKLIGSNSGYVGYEEGGLLTKFVKDNPNCVVLFDEVEKADPQILNILLHLLDEGYIEDNKHEKVDFSNSVVILTSNIGHKEASTKSMGFVQDDTPKENSYNKSIKKQLKPELLARINDIMVFNELNDKDTKRIIISELRNIKKSLGEKGVDLKFNNSTVDVIFNNLKAKNLHARSIKGYIREKIQIPIAKTVIKNSKLSEISLKSVDNKIKVC